MFKNRKMIRDVMRKTSCTKEQAKYLVEELSKLPKIKDIVWKHMGDMNLYNFNKIKVVRCMGYMDDNVIIVAYRVYDVIAGAEFNRMYVWNFVADKPEYVGFKII